MNDKPRKQKLTTAEKRAQKFPTRAQARERAILRSHQPRTSGAP